MKLKQVKKLKNDRTKKANCFFWFMGKERVKEAKAFFESHNNFMQSLHK